MDPLKASQRPRIGETFGRYELVQELKGGPNASVFIARSSSGTRLALKLVALPGSVEPAARIRIERESRLLGRVDHPNVVSILATGVEREHLYIAMQLIEGETLAERLRVGALPLLELAPVGQQLLDGVQAIHAAGVLHRDLTPSNIILERDQVRIVDFGLATLVGEETITRGRNIWMTLAYAAPERISGCHQTQGADLYQVALVLYEMCTGQRVFADADVSLLATAHLTRRPPSARALRPALSPFIDAFFGRALRKEPAERYPDAESMARDWRFVAGD